MDEITFDILRTAVNLVRNEEIRRLSTLRMRLATLYPDMEEQRNAAIAAWIFHGSAVEIIESMTTDLDEVEIKPETGPTLEI